MEFTRGVEWNRIVLCPHACISPKYALTDKFGNIFMTKAFLEDI